MIDNPIIQEIRQTREKLWEESGCDIKRFFENLIERQKERPNLTRLVTRAGEGATVVEESKKGPYNEKD